MLAVLAVGVAVLLLIGVPIFVALGLPPIFVLMSQDIPLTIMAQRLFGGIDRFSLMAMPFFVLAANLMSRGGVSDRIVRLAEALVGRFFGGTALATALGCMFFGALSGSSPATVAAVGGITKPMLDRNQYGHGFSIGLIMGSSSLAILIPPSITMIIYATVTNVSVGQLFLAGIGPGLTMGLLFMAYAYFYARKRNLRSVPGEDTPKLGAAFRGSIWALGVPVIIIGGIYGGVFTPTEAAVVSCVYAMAIGVIAYRNLNVRSIYHVGHESVVATAQIMVLVAAASVLSWLMTIQQVQVVVNSAIAWAGASSWLILIAMNLILLLGGMFVDPSSLILILGPIFVPIAANLGYSPVHMGAVMVASAAIGMYSPPFGLNLFISKAVWRTEFSVLAKAAIPFVLLAIVGQLLITFVPQISLWIPDLAYGG